MTTVEDLFARLDALGIETRTVDHPPVYTVEEAKAHHGDLPGMHTKNLFLRNKKKKMWLVVTAEDHPVDLKVLGERLGAGRLSFGSADRLRNHLGVEPGAVTPFAVVNDIDGVVRVVLDARIASADPVHCHPLVNTKTTAISGEDLLRFLRQTGHDPQILDLEASR